MLSQPDNHAAPLAAVVAIVAIYFGGGFRASPQGGIEVDAAGIDAEEKRSTTVNPVPSG